MIDTIKVQNLCNKYNIKYKIFPNNIHIETALNTWICMDKDTHYRLKHKNKGVAKHMCHMHNKKFTSINEIIEYINTHDSKTIFDRRRNHERKIDRLFEQIAIHNISNNINNINKINNISLHQ